MTVNTELSKRIYTGNGVATDYDYDFKIPLAGDLAVSLFDLDGVELPQVLNTDYTVTGAGGDNGGKVLFTVPPPNGYTILLLSDAAYTQPTDFKNQGRFFPETHENAIDRAVILSRQNHEAITRSITLPPQVTNVSTQLPVPQVSTLFGWNGDGTAIENFPLSTIATQIAYGDKNYQVFTGTGAQVNFTLSQNPGSLGNLDVSIDGVTQVPVLDYSWAGTTLTFTAPPTNGAVILVRYDTAVPVGSGLASSTQYTPPQTGVIGTVKSFLDSLWTAGADAGSALVRYLQGGTGAQARTLQDKLSESLSLLDFIPVAQHAAIIAGTSTYDATANVQAAINEARARQCDLYVPAGRYRITSTIDAYASTPYSIIGDGSTQSRFFIDFGGASAVGFRFTHPTNQSTRNKQYVLSRVGFIQSGAFNPGAILVEHRYCTDAKWDNVYIQGYQNNTGLVLSDIFNSDFYEVSVWGCGAQRCLRDINALTTASIASGATTLTASASTFSAGDVGKYVVLDGLAPQVFLISGYTSATQVTVSSPARATFTNVRMDFCSSRGSMTSASATLTMDGNVLTAADIGRTVYVLGAGASTGGSGRLPLRATITGVSAANTCTLSVAASTNVTDSLVVISPAVDVFAEAGGTNDVYINGLHIEEHRGVGLVLDTCINTYFDALKVHSTGVPTGGINGASSQANMLVINSSIYAAGDFEQRVGNHLGRVIAVCSPSSGNHFADFSTIAQYGMALIHAMGGTFWSKVTVGNVVCQNQADTDFARQWLTSDASTNGFHHYGTFSSYRQVSTIPGATAQFGAIKSCGVRPPLTMNNNEVRSFKLPSDTKAGVLMLFSDESAVAALAGYAYNATARCAIIAQPAGALYEASTSVLTGTTGTVGKVTVSCTSDGTIYVENRSGGYQQFWYANFS